MIICTTNQNMNHSRGGRGVVAGVLMLSLAATGRSDITIPKHVISSGGGTSTSATHEVRATLGEPVVGRAESETHSIIAGFWGAVLVEGVSVLAPGSEPGGPPCGEPLNCTGAWAEADCVAGMCYIPKNRYLSIDPTVNGGPVAYQVELVEAADYTSSARHCDGADGVPCRRDADCLGQGGSETCLPGRTWWVDAPECYDYPNGNPVLPPPPSCDGEDRFGWVSNLTSAPVTRVWTEVPLHITDCGIAPVVTYHVRASVDDGTNFSDPLEIGTAHAPDGESQFWGDITGGPVPDMPGLWLPPEGATNLADVGNAIRTFENQTEDTAFPPRVWVDVEINQVINLADIQFIVSAFEGRPYADINLPLIGVHPADCP